MIEGIWKTFHQQLLAFIVSKVGDRHLAEDILQDVFVKILKNIDKLSDDEKLQPWLYQICRHSIIDYFRKSSKNETKLDDNAVNRLIAEETEPERGAQLSRCLATLINELPDNMNAILVDSELEQIRQAVIADKYQLTLSAVKARIRRGRTLLKEKLQSCCEFEFNENGPEADCKTDCGCH